MLPEDDDVQGVADTGQSDTLSDITRHIDAAIGATDAQAQTTDTGKSGQATQTPQGQQQGSAGDSGTRRRDDPRARDAEARGNRPQERNGDLVDPQTGQVLARAGQERRLYEEARTLRTQVPALRRELDESRAASQRMTGELAALRSANTIATQLKLTPDEAVFGQKLAAAWKTDPVKTLNFLLTQAKAAGHNIPAGGAQVDTQAIVAALSDVIRPLLSDREANVQNIELERAAQTEANTFFEQYPDARVHEGLLAGMIERNPRLSPTDAYIKLYRKAQELGLDWSQPLAEQYATNSGNTGESQSNTTQARVPTRTAPMSGGRGAAGSAPMSNGSDSGMAHEDASWDDIIRSSMRQAGLSV